MSEFSEEVLIWSMINREEHTKRFKEIFDPNLLQTVKYRPILQEIYKFIDEKGIAPSFKTLHKVFENKDKSQYDMRYKLVLEELEQIEEPDVSEILYHLDLAKDVSIAWSFKELSNSPAVGELIGTYNGKELLGAVTGWCQKFLEGSKDLDMPLDKALKYTVDKGWLMESTKMRCHIEIIDEITGYGLRPKQLGIIIAPTGHGKSTCLIIMAYNFAAVEHKNTLFITNELSIEEVTERFLSKISGVGLDDIIEETAKGYIGVDRHWITGLHERLHILDIPREIDTNELEAIIHQKKLISGWTPKVVVIDFMERMKPIAATGMKRDQTWNWYGAIAQDLVRLSKKLDILIWTAGQTNRAGLNAKEIDLSMGQGSIRHFQEAAAVISLHQADNVDLGESDVKVLAFKSQKARQNKRTAKTFYVKAKLGKMEITNERVEVAEIIEAGADEDEDKPKKKRKFKASY